MGFERQQSLFMFEVDARCKDGAYSNHKNCFFFLASTFTSCLRDKVNICSLVYILEWQSVGKMLFGLQENHLLQYREWPIGLIGSKAEQLLPILVLLISLAQPPLYNHTLHTVQDEYI